MPRWLVAPGLLLLCLLLAGSVARLWSAERGAQLHHASACASPGLWGADVAAASHL